MPASCLIAAVLLPGCTATHYVKVRSNPKSPLVEQLKLTSRGGPQPSVRTVQILRRYDLDRRIQGNLDLLLSEFQTILDREPTPDKLYAFAELCYVSGKRYELKDPALALDRYGTSTMHAYLYLFDERFGPLRNPYDPEFRRACDLYNLSLESVLRIVQRRGGLLPGQMHGIESPTQTWDVKVVVRDGPWGPEDFTEFKFVSDYEVQGLKNQHHTFGLGVPLIAIRKRDKPHAGDEPFLPPLVSFPVTAFLRVLPDDGASRSGSRPCHAALLELYDPLTSTNIMVGRRQVPLESDLSTPLAYFLNDPQLDAKNPKLNLEDIATQGLLHPDKTQAEAGLYMLQPYEPGKIPVLMIHGLWSSPMTWMEMFNDLRSDPLIRDRYQFWFYLYPTGEPFWQTATKLRGDLSHARDVLDPKGVEPAFDEVVLVGHSMGGLIAKMQTVTSGNAFWHIVSDLPFDSLNAQPDVRNQLEHTFFFQPLPGVRRLITIATPNRGTKIANDTVRFVARELIHMPQISLTGRQQLLKDNPGLFRDATMVKVKTSLDSLAPDSPILPVLLHARHPASVTYHNIVGVLPDKGLVGRVAGGTDGVVSFESAHLDDAASELKVDADHMTVHRHPLSILEVRRILLEHLQDIDVTASKARHRRVALEAPSPAPNVRKLPDKDSNLGLSG